MNAATISTTATPMMIQTYTIVLLDPEPLCAASCIPLAADSVLWGGEAPFPTPNTVSDAGMTTVFRSPGGCRRRPLGTTSCRSRSRSKDAPAASRLRQGFLGFPRQGWFRQRR